MPIQNAEVGPKYDIVIRTRDGSTLPCAGRPPQRSLVNLSECGYMTSTTTQQGQHEATELQRMTNLITQSSNQETDRTFDAWAQVDQGDWSDGMLQRVFSGAQNRPTKYWDGNGVVWPITDPVPQRPLSAIPDQAEAGARMRQAGQGVVGGLLFGLGGTQNIGSNSSAYAYMYMKNPGGVGGSNVIVLQGDAAQRKIDPAPGSTAGTPFRACDYLIYSNSFWYVYQRLATTIGLIVYSASGPPVALVTTDLTATGIWLDPGSRIALGYVANKLYLALTYDDSGTGDIVLQVFDVSGSAPYTTFTKVTLCTGTATAQFFVNPFQVEFVGTTVVVGISLGQGCSILQFDIPSQTVSTLVYLPTASNLYFCSIAGSLFILAANDFSNSGTANSVDMYLLQGTNLQHIGPVDVQATAQGIGNVISGECEPVAFGSYAVFAVYYFPVGSVTGTHVTVFAYDVLRGRLFKLQDLGGYSQTLGNRHGRRMALLPPMNRTVVGGTLAMQWGVGLPVLSDAGNTSDVNNVQDLMMGVSSGGFQPLLQQGVVLTSSLIDFTSSQNKLYRQVIASFSPLPNDPTITIKLDVWLDQDPANLNPVPDFTTGTVGAGVGGGVAGQEQLTLLINQVGRKIVYRVTTSDPNPATLAPAVDLTSVAVRVATGWTIHYFLDMARSARTNGGNSLAFAEQGIDELQAYNFVRQLWRLKGGECTVVLANGDSYNAILQLIDGASVKPYGASTQGQEPTFQQIVEIKIREDV